MSLPEAVQLGLRNSELIRVVAVGTHGVVPTGSIAWNPALANLPVGPDGRLVQDVPLATLGLDTVDLMITPANAAAANGSFRSALLAHVRSVEQQYWALTLMRVTQASRQTAIERAEAILQRERAELPQGRSTTADIAEAEQQLENFKLNLVTAESDLATTERQLRVILGLTVSDPRRIIPTTAPLLIKLEPQWDESLAQMRAYHPDVATQREVLTSAALREVYARDDTTLAVATRQAREQQQQISANLNEQATHMLARFFLEVDANYKQYQTAKGLKTKAAQRLEAQQAFAAEGRVTVDRLLDAVSQDANATVQEAQYLLSYNTSIAALEEAKGTLLDHDGVTVVLSVRPRTGTPAPAPLAKAAPAGTATATPTTTYKVRASVAGVKLIDVEVEKTATSLP